MNSSSTLDYQYWIFFSSNPHKKVYQKFQKLSMVANRPVSSIITHTLSVQEVWGSIPGSVKSAQCRQQLAIVATFLWSCVAQTPSRGYGPATRYKLRRNAASIIKIGFIGFDYRWVSSNKTYNWSFCTVEIGRAVFFPFIRSPHSMKNNWKPFRRQMFPIAKLLSENKISTFN